MSERKYTINKHKEPMVTVLMPVYNVESFIEEAISSILNQTYTDFEFLIIDDGSEDNTPSVVQKYQDKRIRFINNKKHNGLVYVLNQGLSIARGRYIARMDGDDISLPTRLEKQVRYMKLHPEIDICGTWFTLFDSKSENGLCTRPTNPAACRAMLLFTDPVCHATIILRPEVLRKFHYKYDSSYQHLEDYEFFNRISSRVRFGNIDESLYKYRYHEKRTGRVYKNEQEKQMQRVQKTYLSKLGIPDPERYIDIHWKITTRRFKPSKAFLKKSREWLLVLLSANQKAQIYDADEFKKVIEKRWSIIYRDCYYQNVDSVTKGWAFHLKRKVTLAVGRALLPAKKLGLPIKKIFDIGRQSITVPSLEVVTS